MRDHPIDRRAGRHEVKVSQRRTKQDFAQVMRELVDVDFPQAEKKRVVFDHLNTKAPVSLHEAFAPQETRR